MTAKLRKGKVSVVSKDEVPTFYFNNAQVLTSAWDMKIEMRQLEAIDKENNTLVVSPVCTVLTSWPHAKVLARIMQRMVDNYEKSVGPIPLEMPEDEREDVVQAEIAPEE